MLCGLVQPHGGEQTCAPCLAPWLGDCRLCKACSRSGPLNAAPLARPGPALSAVTQGDARDAPLTGFLLLRFQVWSHLSFIVPTGPVFSVRFCRMLFSGSRVLWCSRSTCMDSLSRFSACCVRVV